MCSKESSLSTACPRSTSSARTRKVTRWTRTEDSTLDSESHLHARTLLIRSIIPHCRAHSDSSTSPRATKLSSSCRSSSGQCSGSRRRDGAVRTARQTTKVLRAITNSLSKVGGIWVSARVHWMRSGDSRRDLEPSKHQSRRSLALIRLAVSGQASIEGDEVWQLAVPALTVSMFGAGLSTESRMLL